MSIASRMLLRLPRKGRHCWRSVSNGKNSAASRCLTRPVETTDNAGHVFLSLCPALPAPSSKLVWECLKEIPRGAAVMEDPLGSLGPFKSHRFRRLQTWDRPRVLPHGKMRYNGLLPGDPANVKRPWLNG